MTLIHNVHDTRYIHMKDHSAWGNWVKFHFPNTHLAKQCLIITPHPAIPLWPHDLFTPSPTPPVRQVHTFIQSFAQRSLGVPYYSKGKHEHICRLHASRVCRLSLGSSHSLPS